MSLGIEMGMIRGMLEITFAKFRILDLDTARRGSIEEGEAMPLTSLLNGTYHQWETLMGHVPW